jgi:hypothetical protein
LKTHIRSGWSTRTETAVNHSLRALLPMLAALLLSGCDRDTPRPDLVAAESKPYFLHHVVDAAPPGGRECCTDVVAVADINRDGYSDIVVGGEHARGAGLVWYEYPTWLKHDIAEGDFTTDGKTIDFDGDGDVDVVVGDVPRGLYWFEQTETATWIGHKLHDGYVHDLVVADLDGDGKPDCVIADKKGAYVLFDRCSEPRQDLSVDVGEGLQTADLDADGDLDVLYSRQWVEQRRSGSEVKWIVHDVAPEWDPNTRIQVADLNGDRRVDVILSGSEGESPLAWFEAPEDLQSQTWTRHVIGDETLVGAHSLAVADFDLDGDIDVVVAEMNTSPGKRVQVYLNDQAAVSWQRIRLAAHGSHNLVVADLDRDGDPDIVGKNYEGASRFLEYWENRNADLRLVPPTGGAKALSHADWAYQPIDTARPAHDAHTFGLVSADINGDGFDDIAAGGSLYINPGRDAGRPWHRMEVAAGSDLIHISPHRHNEWSTLVGVSADALEIVTADSTNGRSWSRRKLHRLPEGRSQGYTEGPGTANGYKVYFTRGPTLFQLAVNGESPAAWQMSVLQKQVQEEGVSVADLDGDGNTDLITVDEDGKRLLWLETDSAAAVRVRHLGGSLHWIDRVAIADINGDHRLDVLYTEETRDLDYNARVVWLEAPADRRLGVWKSHTIVVLRSVNSLDVRDMDGDGDVDVIVAEHTDLRAGQLTPDNFTGVFLNRGDGSFGLEVVEIGPHSSHLGARAVRNGPGGGFDIVSIGWEQVCCVHRWVRAKTAGAAEATNRSGTFRKGN